MRNTIIITIIVVILASAYFFFWNQDKSVAVVNGVSIPNSLYQTRVARALINAEDVNEEELREVVLMDSIHEELFIQEAERLGFTADIDELCQEKILLYGEEAVNDSLVKQEMTMEDFCWENHRQHLVSMVVKEKDMGYEEILEELVENAEIVIK